MLNNMDFLPKWQNRGPNSNNKAYELDIYSTAPAEAACHPALDNSPDSENSHKQRQQRQQILILISCLILTFTGCGINFAFGVYQEFYETRDGPFQDASPGAIDLIGTISASLMTVGAPFTNALSKSYGSRSVVLLGGILFAISGIAASFGTRLWHFQLSQGLLQGCAACLTYIPAVTVSPGYFNERRALAMGIITSGTGLGGMAWAPFLRYLISTVGFRNTLRMAGSMAAALIALSALVLKEAKSTSSTSDESAQSPDDDDRQNTDVGYRKSSLPYKTKWSLVGSPEFISHACGTALQAAAYMIPVYFMSSYARTLGYSTTAGANIIALSNACNSGGKIIIGYYADRVGRLNALVLSTFISAVSTFALCYVSISQINNDMHGVLFVAYACIYGITAGSYVSLFPTALVEQFGITDFARVNGLLYMIRGIGTLIGTPLGGAMVRYNKEWKEPVISADFDRTFLFVGFLLLGATVSVAWARTLKNSLHWRA